MGVKWVDVHKELTNKIRWTIGTTAGGIPCNIPYRDSLSIASSIASDLTEALKLLDESPELGFSEATRLVWTKKGRKPIDKVTR